MQRSPVSDPEQVLLEHLAFIERTAARACRRRRLGPSETEEFVSLVNLKLVDDDYAVIRRFKGRRGAKITTYLVLVVENALRDYLDHLYGKWRPSAAAKRLGPVAVELDRLLTRDGRSFEEACRVLGDREEGEADRGELERIARELPERTGRRMEGEEVLARLPAPDDRPDAPLLDGERRQRREEILGLLRGAVDDLPPEDRLILKLKSDGLQVSRIARTLHLDQKPLYPRIKRIEGHLREALESRGVDAAEVREVVG